MCGQVIMVHDNQNIFFLNSWPQRMTASEEMKIIAKVLQKSLHHAMTIAMLFNGPHYDDYIGNDESDKKVLSRHNAARQLERGWHPLTFFTLVRAPLEATTMTQSHGITILIVMVVMATWPVWLWICCQAIRIEFTMDMQLIVRITLMAIMLSLDDDDDGD